MRERRLAASGVGSTLAVNVGQKRNAYDRGPLPAGLFSGPGWVLGYPGGPPPHPGPAVHSEYGSTALHWAAAYGSRRIVRLLIAANADMNAQNRLGCEGLSASASASGAAASNRLPCRSTPLHDAAYNGASDAIAELLARGAGAVQDHFG